MNLSSALIFDQQTKSTHTQYFLHAQTRRNWKYRTFIIGSSTRSLAINPVYYANQQEQINIRIDQSLAGLYVYDVSSQVFHETKTKSRIIKWFLSPTLDEAHIFPIVAWCVCALSLKLNFFFAWHIYNPTFPHFLCKVENPSLSLRTTRCFRAECTRMLVCAFESWSVRTLLFDIEFHKRRSPCHICIFQSECEFMCISKRWKCL